MFVSGLSGRSEMWNKATQHFCAITAITPYKLFNTADPVLTSLSLEKLYKFQSFFCEDKNNY